MLLFHAPVSEADRNTLQISGAAGLSGGGFFERGIGGAILLSLPAAERVRVAGALGGGLRLGRQPLDLCSHTDPECKPGHLTDHPPDWLFSGRLSAEYWLLRNGLVRLFAGVGGGGMDTGLVYGTLDTGLLLAYQLWGRLTPHLAGFVAVSQPFARGAVIDHDLRPGTSVYGGGNAGVAVRLFGRVSASGEIVVAPVMSAEEDGAVVAGSIGLSVRFE
jgi:hypothetical protein